MGKRTINVPDLSVMSSYNATHAVVVATVLGDDDFDGATLEERE